MDDANLGAAIAIAAAGGLCNGVNPGHQPDHRTKVDIDTGFDKLRAHTKDGELIFKATPDVNENFLAVRRTHVSAEMKYLIIFHRCTAGLKNIPCCILGVDDYQATPNTQQLFTRQTCNLCVCPSTRLSAITHINPLQIIEQSVNIGHDFVMLSQANSAFVGGHLIQ